MNGPAPRHTSSGDPLGPDPDVDDRADALLALLGGLAGLAGLGSRPCPPSLPGARRGPRPGLVVEVARRPGAASSNPVASAGEWGLFARFPVPLKDKDMALGAEERGARPQLLRGAGPYRHAAPPRDATSPHPPAVTGGIAADARARSTAVGRLLVRVPGVVGSGPS